MRKNPSRHEELRIYVRMLLASFFIHLISYLLGFRFIGLLSMIGVNLLSFQTCVKFHKIYIEPIEQMQYENLDSSMSSEEAEEAEQTEEADETEDTVEAEEADEGDEVASSFLRNRINPGMKNVRTPSSTSLIGEDRVTSPYPPLPGSYDCESSSEDEAAIQQETSEEE